MSSMLQPQDSGTGFWVYVPVNLLLLSTQNILLSNMFSTKITMWQTPSFSWNLCPMRLIPITSFKTTNPHPYPNSSQFSTLFFIFSQKWSESRSVMSDSLQPHWLYSAWNSPGQNIGVSSHSLLQGIFPTQGLNPGLPYCRQILYQLSHQVEYWSGEPIPSPVDLPNQGIEPGSPALQEDFLPAELTLACINHFLE